MKPKFIAMLVLLLSIAVASCKKESKASKSQKELEGTWVAVNNISSAAGARVRVIFGPNNMVTFTSYYIDENTGAIKSYNSKQVSKYRIVSENGLELYDIIPYTKESNATVTNEDNLVKGEMLQSTQPYSFRFNDTRTKLNLNNICGPNANCIGPQEYIKQ
ncbi:hypothetical protein [uncultured Mucilaginibacter sp.]|uniref:hypothetical protein n=1 Tax=uncultured Mucilaginibacter sp. TaxID=797541 RepID=UPI0025FCCA9C|nr:hypothetical protein [uncultured Mucilaginibacter sp.]